MTFLILDGRDNVLILILMETLLHQEKKIFINFSKAKTKFSLRLHYNRDNSYLFANEKKKYINLKLVI